MSEFITRRKLITTGLAAAASLAGVKAAVHIADHYGFLAPGAAAPAEAGLALLYSLMKSSVMSVA